MLNRWIASGRVEYNPTLRETFLKDGSAIHISYFTLIIERGHDNRIDKIKCACFDKMADYAYNYIREGDIVYVEGQLQAYLLPDTRKSKLSVAIRDIELLQRNESSQEYDNFDEIKDRMLKAFPDDDSNDNAEIKPKRGRKRKQAETPSEESAETDTTLQDLDKEEVFGETETEDGTETNTDTENLIPF